MAPETPLAPFIGKRSPRVLVVDDEQVNRQLLVALLKRWGATVSTAASGAEALAAVKVFDPDAILLDVMMPGQSGFSVCEVLQADPATRHIPIIFLTALIGENAKAMGFKTGALDYITKPFDARELAARLGARLRAKYAEDALKMHDTRLREETSADPKDQNR